METNMKKFPSNFQESYDFVHESETIGLYSESYSKEMELRSQEAEYSFQFSKISLELQLDARKAQWSHYAGLQRNLFLLIGIIFIGMVSLISACIFLNKDSIAVELIKMVVYISAGGFGGYGISKSKKNEQHEKGRE